MPLTEKKRIAPGISMSTNPSRASRMTEQRAKGESLHERLPACKSTHNIVAEAAAEGKQHLEGRS